MEVELDGSLWLLDLLAALRDSIQQIKEHIRGHEMALRRRGEEVTKIDMHTNILPDKKLWKNIQSCFRALNHIDDKDTFSFSYIGDEEFDSLKVFKILKEARELTVSLLQSVFNFSSMPRPKTKVSRWSLISNALHKRKVACKDDSEDVEANDGGVPKIQLKLQMFQNNIEHIEEGLYFLYRRIIRNRVAVLNFFSL
ncbi:uncharacterized protein LOC122044123 [Zingiber officinale]|uniref:uncharacterized protein LOC122044123 n=1 Tax=Zingiber officinale TaxID=94328 RepID=UPI001C4C2663|nr:uncharacterized protein LOC122044123 [Zingiber officinale]